MISGNCAARSGCMTGDSTKRNCASVPSGMGREMSASEEASGCADSFGALPSSGRSRECWRWKRRKASGRTQVSDASACLRGLARRSATGRFPEGAAPGRASASKQQRTRPGARPARKALICVCGYCSIQIRRRPSLDQQVGCATRGARHQTHQSDVVFHAFNLCERGETQPERIRTAASPVDYGRPPGAAPGPVGAIQAGFSSKKQSRPVSYQVRHDVLLQTKRRDGCMS